MCSLRVTEKSKLKTDFGIENVYINIKDLLAMDIWRNSDTFHKFLFKIIERFKLPLLIFSVVKVDDI